MGAYLACAGKYRFESDLHYSLSAAGSPERQGVRQHDVHYVLPWPPGLSPGVSNRLLAYHQIHFLTIPRGNTGYFAAILSNLV